MAFKSRGGWTDEKQSYLIRHAQDGVGLLSRALGVTDEAVIRHAERSGLRLSYGPEWGELELCPMCAARYVRPQTVAGRAGMCPVCWERAKADAMRERAASVRAEVDYEDAKKRRQRARRASRQAG